ncbi:MAG: Amuc_1099 family pilus-like system protein [Verrucomicrobiales bacterium]|nr:hypothetical protein [Verrucomicrobiae bacterium]
MEINLQKQYEKVLLLIFGLVALGVGGFLLFKSLTSDVKRSVGGVEGSKTVSAPITEIENASKLLAEGATWEQPRKAEKPVFFAVSTPILRKGEEVYDMQDREKEPLWPPVDNWWWYEYKIDPTSPLCLENDEDGDGFTNLAEFTNHTSPRDDQDTPDWQTAIHLAERVEIPYTFKLTYIDPEIQFTRGDPPGRRVWFLIPGRKEDTTGDGRFKVTNVFPAGADPFKDPAQIELVDNFRDDGSPLRLAAGREEYVRPEYQAKLVFDITNEEFQAKEGQTFQFPGLDHELTLENLTAEDAEISYMDENGAKKTFRAKLKQ